MAMTRSIPLRTSCLYYRAALFVPPPPSSSPPPFIPFDKTACGFQEGYMKLLQVHRQSPASLYLRLNSPSLPLCLADVARSLPLVYSDAAEANIFRRLLSTAGNGIIEEKKHRGDDGIGRETLANLPPIIHFHYICANMYICCCTIAHRDVTMLYPDTCSTT